MTNESGTKTTNERGTPMTNESGTPRLMKVELRRLMKVVHAQKRSSEVATRWILELMTREFI